jgi:hypothetical protein
MTGILRSVATEESKPFGALSVTNAEKIRKP